MSWIDAFRPAEEKYKNEVMGATWGHLAPESQKVYHGYIIFTFGDYGDITPIKCEFKDLDDSPWFFQDMADFIYRKSKNRQGEVLKFIGTYWKSKTGKGTFSRQVHSIKLS
jgi:hypothetical protein